MKKNMRYLRLPKKETVNHFAFFRNKDYQKLMRIEEDYLLKYCKQIFKNIEILNNGITFIANYSTRSDSQKFWTQIGCITPWMKNDNVDLIHTEYKEGDTVIRLSLFSVYYSDKGLNWVADCHCLYDVDDIQGKGLEELLTDYFYNASTKGFQNILRCKASDDIWDKLICDLDLIQNEFEDEKQRFIDSVNVQEVYKGVPNHIYQDVLLKLAVNQTKSACFTNDVMEAFEKGNRLCLHKYFEQNIYTLEEKKKILSKMKIDENQIKSVVDSKIQGYKHQLNLLGVGMNKQKDVDYKMLITNKPKEKLKRQIEKD